MALEPKLCMTPTETITGFNYAFTLALYKKLRELNRLCLIYTSPAGERDYQVSAIAASVISYLSEQVGYNMQDLNGITEGSRVSLDRLNSILSHTEEFLAIFSIEE